MASNSIRDTQRQKVYDAERIAFNGGIEERYGPPDFETVAECQAYVDSVTASDAWKALGFSHLGVFESYPLTVKDGRGRKRGAAQPFTNTIKLPRFARLRWYTQHELAHIATSYIHDFAYDENDEDGGAWPGYTDPKTGLVVLTRTVADHGPEFAGLYLYLLGEIVSAEAHDKLKAAFEETGVKVAPYDEPVTVIDTRLDEPAVAVTDTCLGCGLPLAGNRSRFCSDRCRWTHHNRLRHERTEAERHKTCVACGTEFEAKRSDAKTCSARCRQRLRRRS